MASPVTPRFLKASAWVAVLMVFVATNIVWGVRGVRWGIARYSRKLLQPACAEKQGTLFASDEHAAVCLPCSAPRDVGNWP